MNTKLEIWATLLREKQPTLTEHQIQALSMQAASEWYNGTNTELANLFDQYVMLKTLKGIENGSVDSIN